MTRDDIPTRPITYARERFDGFADFTDTKTPEDHFADSTRGMLDPEFSADIPRDPPTFWDRVILVSLFGAGLGTIWYGIDYAVRFFRG